MNTASPLATQYSNLPTPSPEALAHSQRLIDAIWEAMNNGHISVKGYLELALYAPELGYYCAGSHKLGAAGDFVTAPEISSLFGQSLARQVVDILPLLNNAVIFEIGPGTGKLAADILLALEQQDALPDEYWLLEVSADLKAKQKEILQQRCPHLLEKVKWLEGLPDQSFEGVIVANEVLDAMPVHVFQYHNENIINEMFVEYDKNKFISRMQLCDNQQLIAAVKHIQNDLGGEHGWNAGYTSEINLMMAPWLASITENLKKGLVLFIDYGFDRKTYYHPDRNTGTLMCHYRHHAHTDPFLYPGLQDITSHVDFTAVAEAADAAKLNVAGYATQAAFLLSCGITDLVPRDLGVEQQFAYANEIKMLTLPSEMGELFKVMALTRDMNEDLIGFSLQDFRFQL